MAAPTASQSFPRARSRTPSEGRRRFSERLSDIDIGEEGVQWAIALPSGSDLSRDLSDPCNPTSVPVFDAASPGAALDENLLALQ